MSTSNDVMSAGSMSVNTAPEDPTPLLALRPKAAAKTLGLGERKLWELTNRNEIPHIRLGKAVLYPIDALRGWLNERAKKGRQ